MLSVYSPALVDFAAINLIIFSSRILLIKGHVSSQEFSIRIVSKVIPVSTAISAEIIKKNAVNIRKLHYETQPQRKVLIKMIPSNKGMSLNSPLIFTSRFSPMSADVER